jgi:hypothetical protein
LNAGCKASTDRVIRRPDDPPLNRRDATQAIAPTPAATIPRATTAMTSPLFDCPTCLRQARYARHLRRVQRRVCISISKHRSVAASAPERSPIRASLSHPDRPASPDPRSSSSDGVRGFSCVRLVNRAAFTERHDLAVLPVLQPRWLDTFAMVDRGPKVDAV